MKLPQILFLALYFLLGFTCLFWGRSIEQVNPEKLFLDYSGRIDYESFQEQVGHNQLIIFRISKKSDWPKLLDHFDTLKKDVLLSMKDKFATNFQVLSFEDIYQKVIDSKYSGDRFQFVQDLTNTKMNIPLIGQDFIALIISLSKNIPDPFAIDRTFEIVERKMHENKLEFQAGGMGAINRALNESSRQIRDQIFPLMYVLSLILLALFLRKFFPILIIFIPSLISSGISLAFLRIFFSNMNMISSIVPLLSFVLNLALALHLYFTYLEKFNWTETWKEKYRPILLMLFTTVVGLASLYISDIEAIKIFSLSSTSCLILTSTLHLFFGWAAYDYFLKNLEKNRPPLAKWKQYLAYKMKLAYIIPFIFICLTGGMLAAKLIPFETEAANYFNEDSPTRKGFNLIARDILGSPNYEILISEEEQNNWEDLKLLIKMENFEKALLDTIPELKTHKIISPVNMIKEANSFYTNSYSLPAHQLALPVLFNSINESWRKSYAGENLYRISLHGPFLSPDDFKNITTKLNKFLGNFPLAKLTGPSFLMRNGQNGLIRTLIKSLLVSAFIMAFCAAIFFKSWRYFIAFSIVNLMPLFTSLIFFHITGLSFNIATIMTFSIALGMVVDGTFHIAHDYKRNIEKSHLIGQTLTPIFLSTLILALTFSILGLNDFLPIRQFGLCLSINLFCGLFYDLYVLPRLLK